MSAGILDPERIEDRWADRSQSSRSERMEDIEDPLMQKIRYLDKLMDELAKGRAMGNTCLPAGRSCGSERCRTDQR